MNKSFITLAIVVIAFLAVGYGLWRGQTLRRTLGIETTPISAAPNPSNEPDPFRPRRELTAEQKRGCGFTAEVTEGGQYISGTNELTNGNLNYRNLPGTPLKISGYVFGSNDNSRPLKNAIVDVWQADSDGNYHQDALRGTVKTNDQGYYEFLTIFPGRSDSKPRQIHVKVRAEGFDELTTQLIIPTAEGGNIAFEEGTQSNGRPECLVVALDPAQDPALGTFDLRLSD